jgi:hypothetical protein
VSRTDSGARLADVDDASPGGVPARGPTPGHGQRLDRRALQPDQVDQTVAALVGAQDRPHVEPNAAKKRLADAEARLRRYQAAIGAGIDPAGLVEAINTAQAERTAARAELDNAPPPGAITEAEVYAMIDSLGDVGAALDRGNVERLAELYKATDLQVCYEPETSTAEVSIRVNSACVRGGN